MSRPGPRAGSGRVAPFLLAAMALLLPPPPGGRAAGSPAALSGVEAGKRIYREGTLPSGAPLRGTLQGDVALSGAEAACENCHRRSGMGTIEGGKVVRPVTGPALYRPGEKYGRRGGGLHPGGGDAAPWLPYTDETLARAIRDGIGPDGRPLDRVMPRYRIDDGDLALLVSYLKTLSADPAPGVTDRAIRFAAVVDARVSPARRKALRDVLQTSFRERSAGTRHEEQRSRSTSPETPRKFRAYRTLELDVWELSGPEETWEAQIEERYRERPVFALVSGISAGSWAPVHRFCERREIPCLFPNVDLPVPSADGSYTVYFSRGVTLEAEALARHLADQRGSLGGGPIVQLFGDDAASVAAAAAFRQAMEKAGFDDLRDRRVADGNVLAVEDQEARPGAERPSALVLWLRGTVPAGLAPLLEPARGGARIYLSSSLGAGPKAVPPAGPGSSVYLVHPFVLPQDEERAFLRARQWLRSRKIAAADERLQINAFFAASLAGDAVEHLEGWFSRDYLLEWVEHETEGTLSPSAYPRLGLGVGQRYAAKGCYILRLPEDGKGFPSVVGWIVPER